MNTDRIVGMLKCSGQGRVPQILLLLTVASLILIFFDFLILNHIQGREGVNGDPSKYGGRSVFSTNNVDIKEKLINVNIGGLMFQTVATTGLSLLRNSMYKTFYTSVDSISKLQSKPYASGESSVRYPKSSFRILNITSTGYHSINITASDLAGNKREIPDTRHKDCISVQYDVKSLSPSSVIIVFHNEARSTLLRTLHSILHQTVAELLNEIILVDDASSYPWLHQPLTDYVDTLPLVHLVRLSTRQGLIRARLAGAYAAKSDVLVFLDAHVEVNKDWLQPLLLRIKQNPKIVAVPQMDVIQWNTLKYTRPVALFHGSFLWNLEFKYQKVPKRILKTMKTQADPIPSPVMVGCAHAIQREFFFASGSYDDSMKIWGAENLEHSFRIWMIGGRVEVIPCSRVGHIFKPTLPYNFQNEPSTVIQRNLIRTAEVWMDEYKDIFYATQKDIAAVDVTSLNERKRLREKLQSKGFDWYLKSVVPDLPVPPRSATHFGELRNQGFPGQCLQLVFQKLELRSCDLQEVKHKHFMITGDFKLEFDKTCILVHENAIVFDKFCRKYSPHLYLWKYLNMKLVHLISKTCLSVQRNKLVTAGACQDSIESNNIKWRFSYQFNFNRTIKIEDILSEAIFPPDSAKYFGKLESNNICLQVFELQPPELVICSQLPLHEQILYIDKKDGYLRYKNLCLFHSDTSDSSHVFKFLKCNTEHRKFIKVQLDYNSNIKKMILLNLKEKNSCLMYKNGTKGLILSYDMCENVETYWTFTVPKI